MKRPQQNGLIDAVAFISFLLLISTGLLMYLILPAGSGHRLAVWGLGRHDWGTVHFVIALAFLATIGFHLVLHLRWISCMTEGRDPTRRRRRRWLGGVALLTVLLLPLAPFFATVDSTGQDRDHAGKAATMQTSLFRPASLQAAPDTTLSPAVREAMLRTLDDEYKAQAMYQRIMADFGDVLPYRHIVQAEQRHAQALAKHLTRYGVAVPDSPYTADDFETYPSLLAACEASVTAEIDNAALYDQFMAMEMPADVRRVFENNRNASLERHLQAFQRCVERDGNYGPGQGMGQGMGKGQGMGHGQSKGQQMCKKEGSEACQHKGKQQGQGQQRGMGKGQGQSPRNRM